MTNRHFIIGGAQRSATTYLTRVLEAHPEIEFARPMRPEPKFFLKPEEYDQGYDAYFERYFGDLNVSAGTKVLGEKSTSYIEYDLAAERIKAMLPDARLIFIFRHPVERAISNINFSRMHGFEDAPLEQALLRELDNPETVMSMDKAGISVSPQAYLARSDYAACLKSYFAIFDRNQIKVLIKETLTGNAEQIRKVYEFLDVDDQFVPDILAETINASDKTGLNSLSDIARSRLAAHFAPKITELENLCDLDLSVWS